MSCASAGRQARTSAKGSAHFIIGGIVVLRVITASAATNSRSRAA
jgi:hypothetical protein